MTAILYASASDDNAEVWIQPVATEPGVKIDAVFVRREGETFAGLTFDQLLTARKIEIDDKGVATIAESV